jgi:predicted nuclease of predicted toxin-antitoxin system
LKFLIDAMLPPSVVELLDALGHDATAPSKLGAHNLSDDVLVQLAGADNRVIVTENASDFAAVTDCPVLFVRKSWWRTGSLASNLASALDRWADANPEPGPWSHWLPVDLR